MDLLPINFDISVFLEFCLDNDLLGFWERLSFRFWWLLFCLAHFLILIFFLLFSLKSDFFHLTVSCVDVAGFWFLISSIRYNNEIAIILSWHLWTLKFIGSCLSDNRSTCWCRGSRLLEWSSTCSRCHDILEITTSTEFLQTIERREREIIVFVEHVITARTPVLLSVLL